ncbi:hypothetical protein TELCIR_18271, partial [Teladorsagia circumcincta]
MTSLDGVGHTPKLPPVENRSASVQPNQGSRNESAFCNYCCASNANDFLPGLPQQALAHIWALCDINRTGKLNQEQFALIVHLVNMRKRGEELPSTLPQFLIPPSLRVLSVSENGHAAPDANAVTAEHISASDSGEMRRLAEEMEKLLSDRRFAFRGAFTRSVSVYTRYFLNHLNHYREADAQVSQLEADMKVKDSQIKNLQADLQEIAQLKAELAQLEVERLNLTSQLTHEQKGMETAVDRITEVERKRQRDEAQRVQLNEAIAHAETVVNDIQNVL